jgi:hypothetical protein
MTCEREAAILCIALLIGPQSAMSWQQPQGQTGNQGQPQNLLNPNQLDSLVAPLALYPDPILSEVLVASTYPLEIVEAARWVKQNPNLQGKDLAAAATKQPWDASVQGLVALPDLLARLNDNLSWTSDLGNAFLAQQEAVMQAIQRMRKTAAASGALQSTQQQTVSTSAEGDQTYIEIQPASPEVISVPAYDPAAIWGAAYYPYPPIYYPPSTGAVIAAGAISFGAGVAIGAIWANNGGWHNWGWNCGWGHNNVVINNNFINNNHFNHENVANGNNWVHNPAHRAGVPYANRNVANRFGNISGNAISRPTAAQTQQKFNQLEQHGGASGLAGQGRAGDLSGRGSASRLNPGGAAEPGRGAGPAQGAANRMNPGGAGMGADHVGNRALGGGDAGRGAFGGMNQGGMRTQMNSNRGFASHGGGMRMGGGRRR